MNRQQAVATIKEIFDCCSAIEGKSLKLLPPREDNSLSDTFQIHIQTGDDTAIQRCVEDITKKHKLATKLGDGWLVVYKPYPSKH
jgi:hypothetical protein